MNGPPAIVRPPRRGGEDGGLVSSVGALLFAFSLHVYVTSAFKSTPGGDSGELIAEACQLGVAHPPGYPLFVYFARAAMAVLAGDSSTSPAWRVNFACCLLGAISSVLLYLACLNTLELCAFERVPKWAAVSIAGAVAALAATSPLIWLYSIGAEVFVLNNLFIAALLWYGSAFAQAQRAGAATPSSPRRWLMGGALLCGLALCNQHTSVLLIVPLACWVVLSLLRTGRWSVADSAAAVGAGCVGLLPYAHLPIWHAYFRGPGSWGDTTTLAGFVRHVLRQDYGTFQLMGRSADRVRGGVPEDVWSRTLKYGEDLWREQMPFGLPLLVAVGIVASVAVVVAGVEPVEAPAPAQTPRASGLKAAAAPVIRSNAAPAPPVVRLQQGNKSSSSSSSCSSSFPAFLAAALVFYFVVFHSLSNMPLSDPLLYGVHARFWMQPNLLAFLLLGVGACAVLSGVLRVLSRAVGTRWDGAVASLFIAALLMCLRGQYARNHVRLDNSRNDVIARYGRALLEPLPPNAILITGYDFQWTSTRYLQACEGLRPDVAVFNAPVMSFGWFASAQRAYPRVAFPGSHLVGHLTASHAAGGFSLADFIAANGALDGGAALAASYASDPPHPSFTASGVRGMRGGADGTTVGGLGGRPVFLSGVTALYPTDTTHVTQWELQPFGIVEAAVPKYRAHVSTWRNFTAAAGRKGEGSTPTPPARRTLRRHVDALASAWSAATALFDGEVDGAVFDASTWEHATRLDYWTRAVNYATWLLEWSLLPGTARGEGRAPKAGGKAAAEESEDDLCSVGVLAGEEGVVIEVGERGMGGTAV